MGHPKVIKKQDNIPPLEKKIPLHRMHAASLEESRLVSRSVSICAIFLLFTAIYTADYNEYVTQRGGSSTPSWRWRPETRMPLYTKQDHNPRGLSLQKQHGSFKIKKKRERVSREKVTKKTINQKKINEYQD